MSLNSHHFETYQTPILTCMLLFVSDPLHIQLTAAVSVFLLNVYLISSFQQLWQYVFERNQPGLDVLASH